MPPKAKVAAAESAAETQNYRNVFKANPDAQEAFVTSDDQVFLDEAWAKSHAKRLDDKTVKKVARGDQDGEAEDEAGE